MKTNKAQLLFAHRDFDRLNALVEAVHTDVSVLLEEELGRATVVADRNLPADVVAMNSQVRFKDLESAQETEVQIVYPNEADSAAGKISVLAPVGAALIGLRVGQSIEWPIPNGRKRTIKVVSVLQQAESQ